MLRSALLFHYLTAAHELRLDRGFTLSSSLGTWSTLEALKRQHHLLNGNLLNKKEFNEHTLSQHTCTCSTHEVSEEQRNSQFAQVLQTKSQVPTATHFKCQGLVKEKARAMRQGDARVRTGTRLGGQEDMNLLNASSL